MVNIRSWIISVPVIIKQSYQRMLFQVKRKDKVDEHISKSKKHKRPVKKSHC